MNNDKLTTIDDELLDNVSGGASNVRDAVDKILVDSLNLVGALVDARNERAHKFWDTMKALKGSL